MKNSVEANNATLAAIEEVQQMKTDPSVGKSYDNVERMMADLLEEPAPLRFQSSLSWEEIEANFKDVDFFSGIMEGLNEALAYGQGTPSPKTVVRERPTPEEIAATRNNKEKPYEQEKDQRAV